jgi:hypothetical protein
LDSILVPDVFGIYAGGLFRGKLLCNTTWAGKQFANESYVNPMLEYPSATVHSVIYANTGGVAQIHNIEAYGKTQATVAFDNGTMKAFDYLRVITNDAGNGLRLLGKAYADGRFAMYWHLKEDMSMAAKMGLPDG